MVGSVPLDVPPDVEAHFEQLTGDLDPVVQRLLYQYGSRPDKPVAFQAEQIEFIERVVEHLDVVLQARRLGQSRPQRVFLLLGQGGSSKS